MKERLRKLKNNKKVLIILIICLIVLIIGTTFAVWNYGFIGENNTINTGDISLEFLEDNDIISLTNALPISDNQGKSSNETFDFAVTTKANRNISVGYILSIEKLEVDNEYTSLNDSDVKIYLTDDSDNELVSPTKISNLSNYSLYSNINNHSNSITSIKDMYKLRVWIDKDVSTNDWNSSTKLQYKFRINVNEFSSLDKSGANEPVISENMIPVYYDDDAEVWKKADSANQNSTYKWYDYDNKMWANSVTVSSTNRDTYKDADPGTPIPMSDILTMQVWIPRYKYKVWNYNLDGTVSSSPQEIEITFENGTAKTGEITCEDQISGTDGAVSEICKQNNTNCTDATCNDKTYTHPAFTFGDEEVEGIWVGKFESSSDTACTVSSSSAIGAGCNLTTIKPLVKPDVTAWRGAMVSVFENNTMAMNDTNNIYGFASSDDTHVMKNMEWGAVAYLSHSKYGVNREVYINNSSGYYIGRSGGNVGGSTPINETYSGQTSTTEYNAYGYYTYDGYLLEYNTNTKSEAKDMSKVGSTTGNIYGIYDMSGGSYEYVMGNIVSIDGTTMMSGYNTSNNHSGYTGILYDSVNYTSYTGTYSYPNNKYFDKYSFGTSVSQRQRSKLGDALKEVYNTGNYGWNSDYNYLAYNSRPWFLRGGSSYNGADAGLFGSLYYYGDAYSGSASRFSITP